MPGYSVGVTAILDYVTLNSWIVPACVVPMAILGYWILGPLRVRGGTTDGSEPVFDPAQKRTGREDPSDTGDDRSSEGGGD